MAKNGLRSAAPQTAAPGRPPGRSTRRVSANAAPGRPSTCNRSGTARRRPSRPRARSARRRITGTRRSPSPLGPAAAGRLDHRRREVGRDEPACSPTIAAASRPVSPTPAASSSTVSPAAVQLRIIHPRTGVGLLDVGAPALPTRGDRLRDLVDYSRRCFSIASMVIRSSFAAPARRCRAPGRRYDAAPAAQSGVLPMRRARAPSRTASRPRGSRRPIFA